MQKVAMPAIPPRRKTMANSESISNTENPSYRRSEPFVVTDEVRRVIAGAIAELDLEQLRILRTLTPAQRVRQAVSMI
jgi:hypothetical protein